MQIPFNFGREIGATRKMSDNNNSVSITDTNSQILSIVPKHWRVPLIIISYIKGYNVDDYVLEMIRDRLEMFIDTRDELGEDFKKYMQKIEGLTTRRTKQRRRQFF